ncbi:MAG: hypothetical protein KAT77_06560 [Nanoarchaeota archaeon]|nr:hypothetical protein [Nanoarchaeota archaeon]
MKKIISIMFILLVGVIILGGCSSINVQEQPSQRQIQQNTDVKPQEEKTGLKLDNEQYGDLIKLHCEDYLSLKGKYLGKQAENQCYQAIALTTDNMNLCNLMIDAEMASKEEDTNDCIYAFADKKNDEKICEQIQYEDDQKQFEERQHCLAAVWSKLGDVEKCEELEYSVAKNRCIADAS